MSQSRVAKRRAMRVQAVKAARRRAQWAASQVTPRATSTGMAARSAVWHTRAWVAPRLERTGYAFTDRVAPKVTTVMCKTASRISPAPPPRRRWPYVAAGLAVVAGAATAAAIIQRRRSSRPSLPLIEKQEETTTRNVPRPAETGKPTEAGKADVNGRVHSTTS